MSQAAFEAREIMMILVNIIKIPGAQSPGRMKYALWAIEKEKKNIASYKICFKNLQKSYPYGIRRDTQLCMDRLWFSMFGPQNKFQKTD